MKVHFSDLPIYRKAIEIRMLSVSISHYLRDDLCKLRKDGSEDQDIYFSGDIIQQSTNLLSEIREATLLEIGESKKRKYILSTNRLWQLLNKNCKRLELSDSNGKDFLPLLRHELMLFRKLHKKWALTL